MPRPHVPCSRCRTAPIPVNFQSDPQKPSGPKIGTMSSLQVAFGESLRLVGSDSVLGGWDVAQGPELQWSDGDVWSLDLQVPAGQQLRFKVGAQPARVPLLEEPMRQRGLEIVREVPRNGGHHCDRATLSFVLKY